MSQMITRRDFLATSALLPTASAYAQTVEALPIRVALVPPKPGDDYYNACRLGALEAAAEVSGVQLTYTAPATADPVLQAELLGRLVDERLDAIVVAPLASDLVTAACARAVRAGVKVISIDHPLPPDARQLHLAPPDVAETPPQLLSILSLALGGKGEIALLSSAPGEGSHIAFAASLQRELLKGEYSELTLITTVFGNERLQDSYAEALAIIQAYPDLRGILAPSHGGLAGAARAVMDLGRSSSIKVTGVGLPSRMATAVQAGVVPGFLTWSPVDVGYAATRIAIALAKNEVVIQAGTPVLAGRLGQLIVNDNTEAVVGELITVDATTIDKFAEMF